MGNNQENVKLLLFLLLLIFNVVSMYMVGNCLFNDSGFDLCGD